MILSKTKKDNIRRALLDERFPSSLISEAAGPLIEALLSSKAMEEPIALVKEHPHYVTSTGIVTVCMYTDEDAPWRTTARTDISLAGTLYARRNMYGRLEIDVRIKNGRFVFTWNDSFWPECQKLPDLDAPELRQALKKVVAIVKQRNELDDALIRVMNRVSSPHKLIEKVPATAKYLTEELESIRAQKKAVLPMEAVMRIRTLLGHLG